MCVNELLHVVRHQTSAVFSALPPLPCRVLYFGDRQTDRQPDRRTDKVEYRYLNVCVRVRCACVIFLDYTIRLHLSIRNILHSHLSCVILKTIFLPRNREWEREGRRSTETEMMIELSAAIAGSTSVLHFFLLHLLHFICIYLLFITIFFRLRFETGEF